jgi:hypothetical protein
VKRPAVFSIFLGLLLIGNLFAAFQLLTSGEGFLDRFPRLTPAKLNVLRLIPLLNIVALTGVWFWKRWGVVAATGLGLVTIGFDIALEIWYHLIVAAVSVVLLCIGAAWHRDKFRQGMTQTAAGD